MDPYRSGLTLLSIAFTSVNEPDLILDVGCGDGGWLLAAHELKPEALLYGIDLNPFQSIPQATLNKLRRIVEFDSMDLRTPGLFPYEPCSLVICVEVAEHLPVESGPGLVDFVTGPGCPVLWSAALPGQGPYPPEGYTEWNPSWHWNEQPLEHWEDLFAERGFQVDLETTQQLRKPHLDVDPWYGHITLFKPTKPFDERG